MHENSRLISDEFRVLEGQELESYRWAKLERRGRSSKEENHQFTTFLPDSTTVA